MSKSRDWNLYYQPPSEIWLRLFQNTDKSLLLSGKNITDKDLPSLVSFLKLHPDITNVDLSFNQITDFGVAMLVNVASIKNLNLDSNQISFQSAKLLALLPLCKTLDVSFNSGIGDEGAAYLAHGNFSTLKVRACGIKAIGAMSLANSKTIDTLDIGGNPIGDDGGIALALNNRLRWLNLDECQLTAETANYFENNPALKYLKAVANSFGDKGTLCLINSTIPNLIISTQHLTSATKERLENRWQQLDHDSLADPASEKSLAKLSTKIESRATTLRILDARLAQAESKKQLAQTSATKPLKKIK